jgi:hypothetical protein
MPLVQGGNCTLAMHKGIGPGALLHTGGTPWKGPTRGQRAWDTLLLQCCNQTQLVQKNKDQQELRSGTVSRYHKLAKGFQCWDEGIQTAPLALVCGTTTAHCLGCKALSQLETAQYFYSFDKPVRSVGIATQKDSKHVRCWKSLALRPLPEEANRSLQYNTQEE